MVTPKRLSLDHLPSRPGVYVFKNKDGNVIYIGKAKVLKKRVQSYFQNKSHDWKIVALVDEIRTVEFIETKNETEALLLEAQLVGMHKPKFNVLLKSGQPFMYILFTQEELPRVELVRNKKEKGTYFGPFLQKGHARGAYAYVMKTFRLEWCTTQIKNGCLRYHLGLCVGNCKDDFDKEGYLFRIELAKSLLKGRYKESLARLQEQIKKCNERFDFEQSKNLYGYLQNLETIFDTLKTKFSEDTYREEAFSVTAPISAQALPDAAIAYELQQLLGSPTPIHRIDCFDISHFQSSFIVGSCVRFVDGVPDKNSCRRFKIKSLVQQNDYAALQEIVKRRYADSPLPDLMIIDGGKGQLSMVKKIVPQALVISLAKREERLFIDTDTEGIVLDVHTKIGKLCIALRDYAHHFALTYHRLIRKKSLKG